uniref:Uncharacterized protein n=1 Tax=Arundo donax TaxID=35708 RepID=A0A0A9FSA9_ARUDO
MSLSSGAYFSRTFSALETLKRKKERKRRNMSKQKHQITD